MVMRSKHRMGQARRMRTDQGDDMALQDVSPINDQLADIIVRASEPWIETAPGMAWTKVLWTGPESGRWVALYRWKKGYVAPAHKHLSAAHTYVLKGRLQVRDGVLEAGDYDYEPNGVLHGETTALEDTEYLFICDGPVVFYNADGIVAYKGWEELQRMKDKAVAARQPKAA
jgi:anti-sigma factor ChrR (cupin superfamily)